MWKIVVGFLVFAAAALYVISTSGPVDMGGEKHSGDIHVTPAPGASAPAAAPAAAPASAPASAASAP